MRRLYRVNIIICSVVFWGILSSSVIYGETLPESIKQMVLKDLGFYEPVNKSFTSQLFVSKATMGSIMFERDAEMTGRGAKTGLWRIKFFIPNGYLKKLPTKSDRGQFDWGEYLEGVGGGVKDLVPTEKFKPHLRKTKGEMVTVTLAKRVLESINYTNKWKLNDLDTWSFTFIYFLEPILPELPQLGPFTGKGTAMINPATGKFETATEKEVGRYGSSLGDNGYQEYTTWVEKQSVKAEEQPVKSDNTSQDSDCSRDRHEEAKTGKPMCKEYWPQKNIQIQPFKRRK